MSLSRFATRDITADVVVDLDRKVALGGYGDVYKGRLNHEVDGHSGEVCILHDDLVLTDRLVGGREGRSLYSRQRTEEGHEGAFGW